MYLGLNLPHSIFKMGLSLPKNVKMELNLPNPMHNMLNVFNVFNNQIHYKISNAIIYVGIYYFGYAKIWPTYFIKICINLL